MFEWFLRNLVTITTILFGLADVFVCSFMPEFVTSNIQALAYVFAAQLLFVGILTYYYTGSSLQYLRDEIESFLFGANDTPFDEKKLSFHPDVQRVGKFTKKFLKVQNVIIRPS